jgi:hypothetical protein
MISLLCGFQLRMSVLGFEVSFRLVCLLLLCVPTLESLPCSGSYLFDYYIIVSFVSLN